MRAHLIGALVATGMIVSGANAATRSADALPKIAKVAVTLAAHDAAPGKDKRVGDCRRPLEDKNDKREHRRAKNVKCAATGDAGAVVLHSGDYASQSELQLAIAGLVAAGTAVVVVAGKSNTSSPAPVSKG